MATMNKAGELLKEKFRKVSPIEVQKMLFDEIGRQNYIKLPKPGTNPRGVEITKEALSSLVKNRESKRIEINWQRIKIEFNTYKRWVDLWRED
jgi:hypothetical protein